MTDQTDPPLPSLLFIQALFGMPLFEEFDARPASGEAAEALLSRLERAPAELGQAAVSLYGSRRMMMLAAALISEQWLGDALDRLRDGRTFSKDRDPDISVLGAPPGADAVAFEAGDAGRLAERLVEMRANNVAAARREGPAFWDLYGLDEEGTLVHAHQVLAGMANLDEVRLTAIRGEGGA